MIQAFIGIVVATTIFWNGGFCDIPKDQLGTPTPTFVSDTSSTAVPPATPTSGPCPAGEPGIAADTCP